MGRRLGEIFTRARASQTFCLLAGFVLLVAANAFIPVLSIAARWTAAVFLLRFVRLTTVWPGYLGIASVLVVTIFIAYIGVIPLPLAGVAITALIGGLFSGCAYLCDRIVATHLPGWAASLVFPVASTLLAYAGAQLSPFGTWGNPVYTAGLAGLAGVIAATGLWGATFLIAWAASLINAIWNDFGRRNSKVPALCLALVAGILTWGMFFPGSRSPGAAPVTVAAITPASGTPGIFRCRGDDICRRQNSRQRLDQLFTRSDRAVKQGAKILLWSEGAAQILKRDEAEFRARAGAFAARNNVYLFAGVVVLPDRYLYGRMENKLIAVTPKGISWEYAKAKPVPGEKIAPGAGKVAILDTPYGRIAAVICFDADFPALVRQAGKAKADMLLVSANDWPAISAIHADMATFRAVENGVSLLRASMNGQSVLATSAGRSLARRDTAIPGNELLVGTLPDQGHGTLYRAIGDLCAWLCLGFIVLAAGWAILRARRV